MIQTYVNGKVYDDFCFVDELTEQQAQRLMRNLYDVIMVLVDGWGDAFEEAEEQARRVQPEPKAA